VDKNGKTHTTHQIGVWITLWKVWIFPLCQGEYSKIPACGHAMSMQGQAGKRQEKGVEVVHGCVISGSFFKYNHHEVILWGSGRQMRGSGTRATHC
jgi:hypothetical protein